MKRSSVSPSVAGSVWAGFELKNLIGQIVRCTWRRCGGEAQAGQTTANGFAVEHGEQGRLADAALPEQAYALGPDQRLG